MSLINEAENEVMGQPVMLVFEKKKQTMLFLDDRTRRIHSALRQFSDKWDVTIVTNVKECLRHLSRYEYDEVHLDHDLRGCDFEDPDSSEAGMEVVRYIEKCGWPGGKRKPIFRIHSSNLFAAYLMVTRLQKLDLIAFYERFVYDDEEPHMQYDKEGKPIL